MDRYPPGAWVALGGGIGATGRFLVGGWVTTWAYAAFPWATLAVNVTGSVFLGFILKALPSARSSVPARAFLATGICGGFTTFSTFDLETFSLLQQGRYDVAALYAGASVACCVGGIYAGFVTAAALRRRRVRNDLRSGPGPVHSRSSREGPPEDR